MVHVQIFIHRYQSIRVKSRLGNQRFICTSVVRYYLYTPQMWAARALDQRRGGGVKFLKKFFPHTRNIRYGIPGVELS